MDCFVALKLLIQSLLKYLTVHGIPLEARVFCLTRGEEVALLRVLLQEETIAENMLQHVPFRRCQAMDGPVAIINKQNKTTTTNLPKLPGPDTEDQNRQSPARIRTLEAQAHTVKVSDYPFDLKSPFFHRTFEELQPHLPVTLESVEPPIEVGCS